MWSYLVGSVDRKNIFLHDLLVANLLNTAAPELFIFTNHAVKHKKLQLIPKFALKYVKNKAKKSINWNSVMRHSEAVFKGFAPSRSNNSTRFVELVRPIFLLLDHFLCCPCDLSMEYIDTQHTHTYTHTHTPCVYLPWDNGSDGFPGLLYIFFIGWIKHFIWTYLHLYHGFILVCSPFDTPSPCPLPLTFVFSTKNPKLWFPPSTEKKTL